MPSLKGKFFSPHIGSADSPDARQPVRDQHVEAEQEDQHGGAVLQVAVELPDHAAEPKEADHLERAEETADALRVSGEKGKCISAPSSIMQSTEGKKHSNGAH